MAETLSPTQTTQVSQPIISIKGLEKVYQGGFRALNKVDLDIREGEIFALLGPNGAGKTTLISIVCGIVTPSGGQVIADGCDIKTDFRIARQRIGLVPQELSTDMFESVWDSVTFSRGLFGKPENPAYIEKILKMLALWDKRKAQIRMLSGGMKRRVLIAKALSHEPRILFLDEPSAGVDVELRREMWETVRSLAKSGVTVILTTHYIEEAEEMADRVGVINKGEIILVEETKSLMRKMGQKRLLLHLREPIAEIPAGLEDYDLTLSDDKTLLTYSFDAHADDTGIALLLKKLGEVGVDFKDLQTEQNSLEDIFVSLVHS